MMDEKWKDEYLNQMEGVSEDPHAAYAPALKLPRHPQSAASPLHLSTASPSPEGRKDDDDKARYDLLPPDALYEVVRVYTFGAGKYGDRNWETGIKWGRVFAAICRHLFSWWGGERCDHETGISHLAHAAWGCLTLQAYILRGMEEFDDRKNTK